MTVAALPPAAHARRMAAAVPTQALTRDQAVSHELALATLRDEEHLTALTMIRVGRLIGLAALIALPFLGGSEPLRIALAVMTVIAIALGIVVERRIMKGAYSERMQVVLAYSVSPAVLLSALYFGIYSAAQLFPTLALYFFSRREQFAPAFVLYVLNAIAQAAFAMLVITHVVVDPGLVHPALPTGVLVVGHVLVQIGFLSAFLLGRGSYRASRDAIEKLQAAMIAAGKNDALFNEARLDLDRALAIGGPGRFTEVTFGSYRLGNVIGRGGMGDVYEAVHVETGEPAAVKLLAMRELDDPQSVERFTREVAAIRKLESPHVVRVLDASSARDAQPFLVMERLHGQDLAHHLRERTLSPTELDTMLAQVGAAIEQAWRLGIVHRDLKPHNLFLTDSGVWKVLDFGVAALDEHSNNTLTQGKVVGTPAYMAPEQARGERVDQRADVYALGAIAYRWLTNRPVCSGKDLHTALYQTVHVMPPAPSLLSAELHADVDAALAIALVKDPADRFATVAELRAALAAARTGALDDATRARAAALVARHPWGAARRATTQAE